MSYTALQNVPILVDLVAVTKDTGWSLPGDDTAVHVSCNAGNIELLNYTFIKGNIYFITYEIYSISGGNVQFNIGNAAGTAYTSTGFKVDVITVIDDNPTAFFYSNANAVIQLFNIQTKPELAAPKSQNTVAFSAKNSKWTSFYTFNPDVGFSLFINTYTLFNGNLYNHVNGSAIRNNFYGQSYKSFIEFVDSVGAIVPKTFLSLSMQSNELLITTDDGITTSLGQVSELSEYDFLKDNFSDSIQAVGVYNKEGVYSASFLRDKNTDLLTGDVLKGNYITIELQTTTDEFLTLFTVNTVAKHSYIGSR